MTNEGPKAGKPPGDLQQGTERPSIILGVATVALAALVGFGAVYVIARTPDNGAASKAGADHVQIAQAQPDKPAELPSGAGSNALSRGQMAAFVFKKAPEPLPEFVFLDASGKERSLKDWRGKVVLLNLWATWCIPCRKEMPALDRLQAALGSPEFEVVALSVDRAGAAAAEKFLKTAGVSKLALYVDPTAKLASEFKAIGLPTSILIGRDGREIGRLLGPAEWDGADAVALVRGVMGAN